MKKDWRYKTDKERDLSDEDTVKGMKEAKVDLIEVDYTDEQLDIDLKDMYSPFSPYTPEQKISAAQAYLITGTSDQAQKYCGVKASVIRHWKTRSSWWPDLFIQVRKTKNDELDANFSAVIHSTVGEVADRVSNGDSKLQKDGTLIKVPMGGKELAIVLGIMYEKRALLRGDVTSRTETHSNKDSMKLLQDKFEDIAKQLEAKPIGETYEVIESGTK